MGPSGRLWSAVPVWAAAVCLPMVQARINCFRRECIYVPLRVEIHGYVRI
jgi:hypothetical protein